MLQKLKGRKDNSREHAHRHPYKKSREMDWGPQVEQNAQRAREYATPLETQNKK